MSEELNIRSYEPGDEIAIAELSQLAFGRPVSLAFWQWRFKDNPTRRIMIDLAWSDGVLAAHYAVSPVIVWIHGNEYLTALSMTTMTHPEYRGRGLFTTLAESVYHRMSREGMAMVWGFPNIFSHRGFVRDLAWVDIHEVPTFRKILTEGKPLPPPSPHVKEFKNFDHRFDELWDSVKNNYPVITKRDSHYLSWRYGANPEHEYTILGHIEDNQLLGYAVCKRYQNDVDLVDILSVDDKVGLNLVYGVAEWAIRQESEAINMWFNFTLPLHRELEKLGFYNSEPITYFGARVLQPGLDTTEVYSFKSWYLTMGDSDVY